MTNAPKVDPQYLIIKSKTFSNFISGIPNSVPLLKALMIGETKTMNGKLYVVKMTPAGHPDWRRVKADGADEDDDDAEVDLTDLNTLFDNDHFPQISDIEVIQDVSLGGSTGAVLVKDKTNGTKFVMKKGASKAHVEEEFLTNSIYQLMEVPVPVMKIYQTTSSSFLLSEFIENTTPANDVMDDLIRDDITKNFVLDCLLANWDAYKNDNILINDDDGTAVRVDNGGGLRYSAQGRAKGQNFDGSVNELISMVQNNKAMTSAITQDDIHGQIQEILAKKDDILGLIADPDLFQIMEERLNAIQAIVSNPLSSPKQKKKKGNAKITDKMIEKAYNNVGGDILKYDYKNGWLFLNEIAKIRGYDDLPEVLDESDFKKEYRKDGNILVHRGLQGSAGKSAKDFMKDFTSGDCFFGTVGVYGAGIYSAVNEKKSDFTYNNPGYRTAMSYAGGEEDNIMDMVIPSSAKTIDADALDEMMAEEFFGKEFKDKKAELDSEVENMYGQKKKIEDFENAISDGVKKTMGWNEKTFKILQNSRPEKVYADTDKHPFSKALNYFSVVIDSINGDVKKIDDNNYEISLPNSSDKFILNKLSAAIALKQKNQYTDPYNFHYKKFKEFIINNHYKKIQNKVQDAIVSAKENNEEIKTFKQSLLDSEAKVKAISQEVNSLKHTGSSTLNAVMAKVASRPNGEYRGFYAAIKGYDVILQKNGNGSGGSYAIILNRSKMLVKKFN